ncbi:hypothetical protein LINPERPRIM_LOCUS7892, partial [Linum perenne]
SNRRNQIPPLTPAGRFFSPPTSTSPAKSPSTPPLPFLLLHLMASELDPRNPFLPAADAAWSQRLQQIYSSQAKFNNVPCAQRQVEFSAGFKTLMMELSNFHVMKSKSFVFPESRSPYVL